MFLFFFYREWNRISEIRWFMFTQQLSDNQDTNLDLGQWPKSPKHSVKGRNTTGKEDTHTYSGSINIIHADDQKASAGLVYPTQIPESNHIVQWANTTHWLQVVCDRKHVFSRCLWVGFSASLWLGEMTWCAMRQEVCSEVLISSHCVAFLHTEPHLGPASLWGPEK